MTAGRETVVVTGLGATTPLGGDVASTWLAMPGKGAAACAGSPSRGRRTCRCASPRRPPLTRLRSWAACRRAGWTAASSWQLVAAREAWANVGPPTWTPNGSA